MSYQLRSRKDPASLNTQEQTDIAKGNLTEILITTSSQPLVVPSQLSIVEQIALPMAEANPSQATLSVPTKPETVSDLEGPIRFDPDLSSAPVSVGGASPAGTVGPPSTVMSGRDAASTGNQPSQLYDTVDASSLYLIHDSQEVKHTETAGTTLPPNVVVARPTASSFHTSITTYSTQQLESVAEQQEWFPADDSTSMPDLSPHCADLELSATEMASLPETVLASLLSQAAIPSQDITYTLATRQRASPLPSNTLQSVASLSTEQHPVVACTVSEDLLQAASLLASLGEKNDSSDSVSTKSEEDNASDVSDVTPLGDTDIEPLRTQHELWLPEPTEVLDTYSAHTDKTVVPQTTVLTEASHHANPHPSGVGSRIIQQPPPRYGTISKVSQWLSRGG